MAQIPWNKGLTAKTDERVRAYSEKSKRSTGRHWKQKPETIERRKAYWAKHGRLKTFLGKKHTKEAKDKISQARMGNGNGMFGKSPWNKGRPGPRGSESVHWKGGITPLNHQIRTSLEYKQWRTAVFERDDYTCVWCRARCGKGKAIILHADHIYQFARFPNLRFHIPNGRTLCSKCHYNRAKVEKQDLENYYVEISTGVPAR